MQTSSANGASTPEQHLRAQLELLKNHDTTLSSTTASPTRDTRNVPLQLGLPRQSNGYDSLTIAAEVATRALAAKSSTDAQIHPDLRARPAMMPMVPPSGHSPGASAGPSVIGSVPHAPPAPPPAPIPPSQELPSADGRKAKRELSQSKRAAQNRAAQRAFRQRKEGYIKKLEQQVRDYGQMESSFKAMQNENYALREYVIHLQSRLLDVHGEFPSPPPNINLSQPPPQHPVSAPAASPTPPIESPPAAASGPASSAVSSGPLEAVAQAVAGLAAHEQIAEQQQRQHQQQQSPPHQPIQPPRFPSPPTYKPVEPIDEEMRSTEEIGRPLRPEEAPVEAGV